MSSISNFERSLKNHHSSVGHIPVTRKPVVTGRKLISYLSIFGSQFLSHQKILSVTTEDTAELNEKHVKHKVITTKSIKMALANLCTCRFV